MEFDLSLDRRNFRLQAVARIPQAGISVIFGPSGCGKTSLLRCIAGLERSNGRISIDGKEIQDLAPQHRNIGFVFQQPMLPRHLSVDQLLDLGIRKSGNKSAQYRSELVASLGLHEFCKKNSTQLSGGQKQRVAIAAALARRPKVIMMDEPLTGLDRHSKASLLPFIKSLTTVFGVKILYVTHSHHEVAALADQLLLMNEGKIDQCGPFDEVWKSVVSNHQRYEIEGSYLTGVVRSYDPQFHLAVISVDGNAMHIVCTGKTIEVGEKLRFLVPANHVTLSAVPFSATSSLNHVELTVHSINTTQTPYAMVNCKIGTQHLLASITLKSVHDLDLRPNQTIYASIKATSLKI